jgi:uncharacterized protein YndB with AHSA1/START domain
VITWRLEETIARPAQEVWSLAADVAQHVQWMGAPGTLRSGSPTEVGGRIGYVYKLGPFTFNALAEISSAEPGKRLGYRIVEGAPFDATYTLDLEPTGPGATKASWSGSMQPRGAWRLLTPVFAMETREGEARELKKLKALAEATQ